MAMVMMLDYASTIYELLSRRFEMVRYGCCATLPPPCLLASSKNYDWLVLCKFLMMAFFSIATPFLPEFCSRW